MLAMRQGRYPAGADEIALTDGAAQLLNTRVGASLRLGGVDRTVVGLVENPAKLGDEFALLAPSPDAPRQSVDRPVVRLEGFIEGQTPELVPTSSARGEGRTRRPPPPSSCLCCRRWSCF